jgi:hypothetical protein
VSLSGNGEPVVIALILALVGISGGGVAPKHAVALLLNSAALRKTPVAASPIRAQLQKGEALTVLARSPHRAATASDPAPKGDAPSPDEPGWFWYRVAAASGAKGWVFGEAVALASDNPFLSPNLRGGPAPQRCDLNADGHASRLWFAATDEMGSEPTSPRSASYLVATDPAGKNLAWTQGGRVNDFSGESVERMGCVDLTGDGHPEVILETSAVAPEADSVLFAFEVFQWQDQAFDSVFQIDLPGPSFDAVTGQGYRPTVLVATSGQIVVRSVEHEHQGQVTNDISGSLRTYRWSDVEGTFALVATRTQLPIQARLSTGAALHAAPASQRTTGELPAQTRVVVQRVDRWMDPYAKSPRTVLVSDSRGHSGWVSAADLVFEDTFLSPFLTGDEAARTRFSIVRWPGRP